MSFYKGELRTLNLCKMEENLRGIYFVVLCNQGTNSQLKFNKYQKNDLENSLKEYKQIYYFFGKREGQYLSCINGEKYFIDDERSKNSEGIYMADAYFNKYEDINLGFLLSYENGIVNIEAAIEGESIEGRSYEVIKNCGDLYNKMKEFIDGFII